MNVKVKSLYKTLHPRLKIKFVKYYIIAEKTPSINRLRTLLNYIISLIYYKFKGIMYFSAVVYYSKIHNGWVIVTLNFTRHKINGIWWKYKWWYKMVDENIRTVKGMSYLLKNPEIEKFLHKIIFEVYILREERPLS